MQMLGHTNENIGGGSSPAFALGLDMTSVIKCVANAKEARVLPPGSVIGDCAGGLTFTDAVAAVLESRSRTGWREIEPVPGERWTIIVLDQ